MNKIVTTLNLKIPPRDLKSKDMRHLLSLIFTQWLPLSTCIIQAIIDIVPPPSVAQRTRIPKMLYPDLYEATTTPKNKLEEDLFSCDSSPNACVAAYVSKMFAVRAKDLPENKRRPVTAEEMRRRAREAREARAAAAAENEASGTATPVRSEAEPDVSASDAPPEDDGGEEILGFARLYSGTLRVGTRICALLPKYKPALGPTHPSNEKYILVAGVEGLYTMMGRDLVTVDAVRAGNVFAIKGLAGKVWRNATICSPSEGGLADGGSLDEIKDTLINLGGVHLAVSPQSFTFADG